MAKRVRVKLTKCIQNSQEAGTDEAHMISRVFYEIVLNGNKQGSFYSDIRQPVGAASDADDLEVTPPGGYKGPLNHERFAKGIRNYYHRLVGSSPQGSGSSSRNKTFVMASEFEFDVDA